MRARDLIRAGIPEAPAPRRRWGDDVPVAEMAAQADLVEVVARCDPRIVKMARPGERPED